MSRQRVDPPDTEDDKPQRLLLWVGAGAGAVAIVAVAGTLLWMGLTALIDGFEAIPNPGKVFEPVALQVGTGMAYAIGATVAILLIGAAIRALILLYGGQKKSPSDRAPLDTDISSSGALRRASVSPVNIEPDNSLARRLNPPRIAETNGDHPRR